MFNLIKLEIKKLGLMTTMKGVIISILVIAVLMCVPFLTSKDTDIPYLDFGDLLMGLDNLVRIIFLIYSSTILSKVVISEFKDKTINLMFVYPIKRKRILAAKLIIVVLFTFTTILIGNLIVGTVMFFINRYFNVIHEISLQQMVNVSIHILLNAIAASGIILIPLFWGMRKKTTTSTIVYSIILVVLVCSDINGFSLAKEIPAMLSMGSIGVLVAYLTIKNIEKVDVV